MSTNDPGGGQANAGPSSQVFCPNCHGGNPPGSTTCMWCGQPLPATPVPPDQQPTMPISQPPPPAQQPQYQQQQYQQYQQQYPQQQPPTYQGQYPPPGGYPPATNVQVNRGGGRPVWLFVVLGLIALCVVAGVVIVLLLNSAGRSIVSTVNQAGTAVALTATAIDQSFSNISASAEATGTAVAEQSANEEASANATASALAQSSSSAEESANSTATALAAGSTEPTSTTESAAPTDTAGSSGENPTATTGSSSSGNQTGTVAGGIGSSAETDGLKITLDGVRRDGGNAIFKPDAGNEYMIVALTFENTTKQEQVVSSLLSFSVKDGTGKDYSITFGPEVKGSVDGNIPAGGKLSGESVFEVPKDATGLVFTYTPFMSGSPVSFKLDK